MSTHTFFPKIWIKSSPRIYDFCQVEREYFSVVTRECTSDIDVCGYKFKKGDFVQTDTWSMHMDKTVWG